MKSCPPTSTSTSTAICINSAGRCSSSRVTSPHTIYAPVCSGSWLQHDDHPKSSARKVLWKTHHLGCPGLFAIKTGSEKKCICSCEVAVSLLSALFCFYLQTLCALFRGVHQKNKSASGFDIINMLMGFDKAEQRMKVWTIVPVIFSSSSCCRHHHRASSSVVRS